MVRIKYRYLSYHYTFTDSSKYTFTNNTFSSILNYLIKCDYGELGQSKLINLLLIDCYPENTMVVFRVQRGVENIVKNVLDKCVSLNGKFCAWKCVGMSGSVRNVKKKMLININNDL